MKFINKKGVKGIVFSISNPFKTLQLRKEARSGVAQEIRDMLERHFHEDHEYQKLAAEFCDGNILSPLLAITANAGLSAKPSLCEALERERSRFIKAVEKEPAHYQVFSFMNFRTSVTHQAMHSFMMKIAITTSSFEKVQANENLHEIDLGRACKDSLDDVMTLSAIAAENFAQLSNLGHFPQDRIEALHGQVYSILKDASNFDTAVRETIQDNLLPNIPNLFMMSGMLYLQWNLGFQNDPEPIKSYLDEFDSTLYDALKNLKIK